jgi:hypothetical protein
MTIQLINETGSCKCGKTRFFVNGEPVLRFFCHCIICQNVSQQSFVDVTVFRAGAVTLAESGDVRFKRYRPPPALARGICGACGMPVIGLLRLAPFAKFVFVPAQNLPVETQLPQPMGHIFYHRRVRDVPDELPKISGYWPSELIVIRRILSGAIHGGKDA